MSTKLWNIPEAVLLRDRMRLFHKRNEHYSEWSRPASKHTFWVISRTCSRRTVKRVSGWKSLSPRHSPGQSTGVGSHSLLQGTFPTQESNPGLPHCRQILYQLSHRGSPRILEWAAYPFSTESSRPRNQTGVSCIAGRFFTNWAIREAVLSLKQI